MMPIRLIHWAFRIKTLPAPERYSKDDPNPEHIEIIALPNGREVKQGRIIPSSKSKLRPPTLYEAITGISHT